MLLLLLGVLREFWGWFSTARLNGTSGLEDKMFDLGLVPAMFHEVSTEKRDKLYIVLIVGDVDIAINDIEHNTLRVSK